MSLVKICPTCGNRNQPDEMLCITCMADVSMVIPSDESPNTEKPVTPTNGYAKNSSIDISVNSGDATVLAKNELKLLCEESGDVFIIISGDILGRHYIGSDIFASDKTISRKHAQLLFESKNWYIVDQNSTNGTFINGEKLEPDKKYLLQNNMELRMSDNIHFKVIL